MMIPASMRRTALHVHHQRWLTTTATTNKTINLTPYASPLLLRLHPDRMQRYAKSHPSATSDNEDALKSLNQFLEIAAFGCNNDGYRARKQILSLGDDAHDDPNAPIAWTLRFHIESPSDDENAIDGLVPVDHVVEIPSALVRRTLAHGSYAATRNASDAIATPFARDWQRTTKRVLERLFLAADIPLVNEHSETQLSVWLKEEDTVQEQHARGVTAHNRAMQRVHDNFDGMFMGLLGKEKNIVYPTTTGLEDGPTTQHVVLTRLVAQRLIVEKIEDKDEKRRVFNWLANVLLMNFMELRLHALVWNKVVLIVTKDPTLESPHVMWDSDKPDEGMAVLIPADMDAYALVDVLYAHVDELERALHHRAKQTTRHQHKQQQKTHNTTNTPKKKKHFYADEVAAMFRRR